MAMTDRELLEFIAAQVGILTTDVSGLKGDISGLKEDVSGLKEDVSGLKEDVSGLKEDVSGLKEDVSGLKEDVSGLKEDVSGLKEGQMKLENELSVVKKITMDMEEDHGNKLTLLLDGYKQNSDKLDRVEKEVSKHEEIILRRIK